MIVPVAAGTGYTPFPLLACPIKLSWKTPVEVRFWSRVLPLGNGCWGWLGPLFRGYGRIKADRVMPAHRFAYELIVGPVPADLVLDHLCRNTWCVNPAHLEPVTAVENTRRGLLGEAWARATCSCGHPYITRASGRVCVRCERERGQQYRDRKIAAGWRSTVDGWKRVEDIVPCPRETRQANGRLGALVRWARVKGEVA